MKFIHTDSYKKKWQNNKENNAMLNWRRHYFKAILHQHVEFKMGKNKNHLTKRIMWTQKKHFHFHSQLQNHHYIMNL